MCEDSIPMSNTSSTLGSCPFCDPVIPALAEDQRSGAFARRPSHVDKSSQSAEMTTSVPDI